MGGYHNEYVRGLSDCNVFLILVLTTTSFIIMIFVLSAETSWSANSTVNSISVDCYNFPSTYKHPDCDIYIGGSFLLTSYGSTMANVAWFDGAAKKWMPMGVSTDENSPRRSEVVNKIYKKGGLGASDSKKYVTTIQSNNFYHFHDFFDFYNFLTIFLLCKSFVWVGSSAGIRKFHTQQKKWTAPVDLGWTTPSGVINWIHYVRNSLSTDEIYLCGEFSFACQNGKTCTNVAKYDYSKKTFTAIAASQQLSGAVTACQMGDNDFFYVAGKASYGSKKYFLRVKTTTIESASWDTISNVAEVVQNPLTDLDVCTSGDPGCTTGSVALVGNNGFGGYYNAKDSTFNKFGLGIVGQPQCLTSTVSVSSASTTRGVSVLVGILLMLASLLFFL